MGSFDLTEKNGIKYFTISSFAETGLVKHGFSTRIGGVSQGSFHSLNLGFHTGDSWESVKENRKLFVETLEITINNLVAANQVHKDNIYVAGVKDRGKGALSQDTSIPETDALITRDPEVALIAFFADCVPIMFLDPVQKVIAIAHAGWKGTVLKIAKKTVEKMAEEFGCQRENILAAIGPSIGPCHYEVDIPVIAKFQENFNRWESFIQLKDKGLKGQLNLWEANRITLLEAGLLYEHITVAEVCTFCNPHLLYSYRYDNGNTGRLAGIIMLKD
ncbi:MAG: peptidoglycan editing factor PgeF [Clostridia bacterium]|nr:peptidoglycan editing factor PgeF [Clostridia bacterium]